MINDLKRRIDSPYADLFLEDALAVIEAYTGRVVTESSPKPLRQAAVRLAVIFYNREGIEGESSRVEGGISRQMEAVPLEIQLLLNPYRVVRVLS